ncbi:hypothetical protein BRC81_15630 [Halobacteriales archaeon QS_1_68_20]|nr:MAG: hypothetical protein BRC81_15630 [Halobacteriales archaeon QS_1_68_20]
MRLVLQVLWLVQFALALGMTVISFQAYRQRQSERLKSAFIGFAFISMGVGMSTMVTDLTAELLYFEVARTIPFIVGFSMLYLSLYR